MNTSPTYRTRLALMMVAAFVALTSMASAQLEVRTRDLRLVSNNNTNMVSLQAVNGQSTNYTVTLPLTVGTTGSLLTSTVTGGTSALNWLTPAADGSILTIVSGVPGWSASTPGWLLAGNATTTAWNGATGNYLGTSTTQPLVLATTNATAQSMQMWTGNAERMRILGTGEIGVGTSLPLTNGRMTIAAIAATSGFGLNVDLTGTTTSTGIAVRNIGANGANDAGVLLGTAAAGTGTAMRIGGVTGFNAPATGIALTASTTGIVMTPSATGTTTGVQVGASGGVRARIGAELYATALTGATAIGDRADASAVAGAVGLGTWTSTSGTTGTLYPLVVSSANNNDVYLGSSNADKPAALATTLTGTLNANTTYMYNARMSGLATLVGTTSGTVSIGSPATVTSYTVTLPTTVGATGSILTSTVTGATSALNWLAPATDGSVLTMVGGVPAWSAAAPAGWLLAGNATASAWNGATGNYLGTSTTQPLVLATTNATAQSMQMWTGNAERMRILGTGEIGVGTSLPLTNGRMTIAAIAATSGFGLNVDLTGTTTSTGIAVRNIGANGANDAGILLGTASAGTGTAMRIGGVTGFNAPATGIALTASTTGIVMTPSATGTTTGVQVGASGGVRARIGAELYATALTGATAIGERTDASAVAGAIGLGTWASTSGTTGTLYPLVVSSANNNDVYLGSSNADKPAALATTLTGTLNANTTYMYNARLSGAATFVGSTSGTASITAPATVTGNYTITLPTTVGATGSILTSTVTGATSALNWLAPATDGSVLTMVGGVPAWSAASPAGWLLTGNATASAWNGATGNYLGTSTTQPLVLATTNATAQSMQMWTGNAERMRILGTGEIGVGTSLPLTNGRMTIAAIAATSGFGLNVDLTGTTTSTGIAVRNIGANGANDAGILLGTASAGTGTAMRIGGVTGFNAPATGIALTASTTGLVMTPSATGTTTGVQVGASGGVRARIGAELYATALTGATAIGDRADASAVAGAVGLGTWTSTSGTTGTLYPLVVSSANNNDVYLGSSVADVPAALATTLTGTLNANTTYMYNARVSGAATFVGSTSGTVTISAPATATSHTYRLPTTQGVVGAALRVQSVVGVDAQLGWTPEAVAPAALFARRTTDQAYASNTLANDGALLVTLAASNVYEFECMIAYDGNTTDADLQLAFTVPAGATIRWSVLGTAGASMSPASITGATALQDIPVSANTAGDDMVVFVKGLVVMGVTAGNLQLQAATTTTGKTVNLLTNSFIKATRMN